MREYIGLRVLETWRLERGMGTHSEKAEIGAK